MSTPNNNEVSPTSLVNKLAAEFSAIVDCIQELQQKELAIEILNKYPISNSTWQIYEETPLKVCARIGDITEGLVCEILNQQHCSLEDVGTLINPNSKRRTALHVAAENGCVRIVELLLDNGAKINCEDSEKRTPLHLAALNMQKEVLILLMNRGAKRQAVDMDNQTPVDLLARRMYDDELSNFKVTEEGMNAVKPKRGRPSKVKKEEKSAMPQSPTLYYPGQPMPMPYQMPMMYQMPETMQMMYCVVNTDPNGVQYAQPVQYSPYMQQPVQYSPYMQQPIQMPQYSSPSQHVQASSQPVQVPQSLQKPKYVIRTPEISPEKLQKVYAFKSTNETENTNLDQFEIGGFPF